MFNFDAFKGFLFWFVIIVAGWWYFAIYQPSHPPKPSVEEIDKENRFKAERYEEAHPEENDNLAILSAKYGIGIKSVQTVIQSYNSLDSDKQKNKQEFISDIAKKAGISVQTAAAIIIDYSYLTSDCSQPA